MPETMATPKNPCAVIDCERPGRPQVCNADGKYHHHGRTHYNDHHPETMQVRPIEDGWFFMCDEHNAEIAAWIEQRRGAIR